LKTPRKFRFINLIKKPSHIAAALIVVFLLLLCYARFIEPFTLKVNRVSVESPLVAGAAENLRIAVFGDTHFSDYYSPGDFEKAAAAINAAAPDLVVFSGDLIDHYDAYQGEPGAISAELAKIKAPLGKFAVFGNHDYGGGAEYKYPAIMEAGGFQVLKNEYYGLDELGIGLIGIDDVIIGYGDPSIAGWGREDYFNIVLAHEPDLADEVLKYNVNLMIAGHTHGRQINLGIFDGYILPPYGKKYISGAFQFDNGRNTLLYVNSGLGMTKLPLRFFSPPELTIITLNRVSGED
jgi:predicted MPP superfamily phosphohydrolase